MARSAWNRQAAAEIAADYALRGADAIYVAVARRHNCALVSLDREQRDRATAIVATRTLPRRWPSCGCLHNQV